MNGEGMVGVEKVNDLSPSSHLKVQEPVAWIFESKGG